MLFFFRKEMISEVLPTATLLVNKQPTLLRIMFGLYKSVFGLAIITASTFAASAVRRRAPMFPGFSGASATKIRGLWVVGGRFAKDKILEYEVAIMPSVELR